MKIRTSFGIVIGICVWVAAPLQAQNRLADLNDAAWKMFNSGQTEAAATLFAEALELRPDDPVLLLGAGAAAQRQGRPVDAMARLHRALTADPALIAASRLLGEIAYSQGELALAIRTYEQALVHTPGDGAIRARLDEWRARAERDAERAAPFTVTLEGRVDAAVAQRAADHLEESLSRVEDGLRAAPSGALVVLLDGEEPVAGMLRTPEWSEAAFSGRIRVPAEGALGTPVLFERLLTHEVTHALIAALAPRGVPAWLHEGLAQHFAGEDCAAARRRLSTARQIIPLPELERGFAHLDAADAQLAYDQSLLAVQPLLARADFRWAEFLAALDSDLAVADVLARFGVTYAQLQDEWTRGRTVVPSRTSD